MWIHPEDKVTIGQRKLKVESVSGLYSCGPVTVNLIDLATNKSETYPLLKFNELHDQGKIKVVQHIKRNFHGY